MLRMNDLFSIDNLDLLTEEEKEFNSNYVKKLQSYADGKVDGVHIRNLTSGAATIAKRQQSRSAVAVLKFNMVLKSGEDISTIEDNTEKTKRIEHKGK